LIDGELAYQAALKRTDEDLAVLEKLLDSPGQALTDDEALAELDLSFHQEIARIGDNPFLTAMVDALAAPIRSFLTCYVKVHGDRESVIQRHRPVLEAIRARDPEEAREAACAHLQACKSSVDMVIDGVRS
jgi:GntR family transcriptional repressor for pyruvate dehydrogenase complex